MMSEQGFGRERLRVLHIAGAWYPHQEHPFQGIFVRRHVEAASRRHQVAVLHPLGVAGGPAVPEIVFNRHGMIDETQVRFGQSTGSLQRQRRSFRAGRMGCAAILDRFGRPDLIHLHVVPAAGLATAVLTVFRDVPMVLTEHWSGYLPESGVTLSRWRRVYTRLLARRARAVSTVSRYHAEALAALVPGLQPVVIPNVVDGSVFQPQQHRSPGPFRFIHVSGLRPEKRAAAIVDAAVRVIRGGCPMELHVVGEGPDGPACRSIASASGLPGQSIVFHGRLDPPEVAERMAGSDALVLASRFENAPCVIPEAFACGIPVLATRVGGIPEMVDSSRGVLVPPDDDEALAAGLRTMAGRAESWDRRALRRYAESVFSVEAISDRLDQLYRSALGASAPPEHR